jgi:signal transduction histidine kinase
VGVKAQRDDKSASEALGKLLSRAGHDVRGPAGNVVSVLDEIERGLGAKDAEASASFFVIARRSVKKLLHLAERFSVLSELHRQPALPAQPLELDVLVRAAVTEASFMYGRRSVDVAQDLAQLSGVGCERWLTAAVMDAMMLALRLARARVGVQLEKQRGAARIVVAGDGGADALEKAWATALSGSDLSDESALPIQVISGVLAAHDGAARVERAGEGARIVLDWPSDAAPRGGDA